MSLPRDKNPTQKKSTLGYMKVLKIFRVNRMKTRNPHGKFSSQTPDLLNSKEDENRMYWYKKVALLPQVDFLKTDVCFFEQIKKGSLPVKFSRIFLSGDLF